MIVTILRIYQSNEENHSHNIYCASQVDRYPAHDYNIIHRTLFRE